MERDAITQYTVLGTLVDRAVCMPYARPQVLREGRRRRQKLDGSWETMTSVQEDVALAADFIVRSLQSPAAQKRWSPAELALDAGGPWGRKLAIFSSIFKRLNENGYLIVYHLLRQLRHQLLKAGPS